MRERVVMRKRVVLYLGDEVEGLPLIPVEVMIVVFVEVLIPIWSI